MKNRVVITGLGVVAPNGVGISAFLTSLREGNSGIDFIPELKEFNFGCQIAGIPLLRHAHVLKYIPEKLFNRLNGPALIFGMVAAGEAWENAGFNIENNTGPDWETGSVFGVGCPGSELNHSVMKEVDEKRVRYVRPSAISQGMASGISAYMSGLLKIGNQVITNSSACATGVEAIGLGFERIKYGKAKRMIVGSCETYGKYIWAGFDTMRVLTRNFNDHPTKASRPMSKSTGGFVPGSGAGALVLEELDSALARGATIYAEILGQDTNCGAQCGSGSMNFPNLLAVQRVIEGALKDSAVTSDKIDLISGHLAGTKFDALEVTIWSKVLDRCGDDFPYINSLKSMTGHCIAATGSIESVACVLQLKEGFIHPSLNSEDLHPDISSTISPEKVPQKAIYPRNLDIIVKANFGFGDVNSCVVFRKWND
jgi:3-oxoacyl-(acyl-carrier-protein) synthase